MTNIEKKIELPLVPPRGWRERVAKECECSLTSVSTAIHTNQKGELSERIRAKYIELYGTVVEYK